MDGTCMVPAIGAASFMEAAFAHLPDILRCFSSTKKGFLHAGQNVMSLQQCVKIIFLYSRGCSWLAWKIRAFLVLNFLSHKPQLNFFPNFDITRDWDG